MERETAEAEADSSRLGRGSCSRSFSERWGPGRASEDGAGGCLPDSPSRLDHSQAKHKSTTGSEPAHGVQPVLITRRQSRDSHLSLYSGGVLHRERFNSATAGTCECSHLCDVSGWSC